jgi:organic hydroperoxide reductase OsmC/OhrA
MQGYPHHYLVSGSGGIQGDVVVSGEGLPDMATQAPPQFGGPEGTWSPETMITASVANCFILTFRAITKASKFEWTSLDCTVDGVLDRPEKVTFFSAFNIDAVLHLPEGARPELAQRLLEKAEQLCLITASLKSEINLTTDIQFEQAKNL